MTGKDVHRLPRVPEGRPVIAMSQERHELLYAQPGRLPELNDKNPGFKRPSRGHGMHRRPYRQHAHGLCVREVAVRRRGRDAPVIVVRGGQW